MLYTRKGDNGMTSTFGCDQKISKSSNIAEALGSLDEINSFIGLIKVKAEGFSFTNLNGKKIFISEFLHQIQQDLFIIQAELAGSDKKINKEKVVFLENFTDAIEKILPPINSFFISGGTELAALSDVARTIARRAERRVTAVLIEGQVAVGADTSSYLNRLSSVLYALARIFNHLEGTTEEAPNYK
jgi:cob(I)alamin adenosyltransferase